MLAFVGHFRHDFLENFLDIRRQAVPLVHIHDAHRPGIDSQIHHGDLFGHFLDLRGKPHGYRKETTINHMLLHGLKPVRLHQIDTDGIDGAVETRHIWTPGAYLFTLQIFNGFQIGPGPQLVFRQHLDVDQFHILFFQLAFNGIHPIK